MPESKIRALVVDDSALYRKFVKTVLSEIEGVEVVGTASNGLIALEKVESLKPDLITLDQEMPELDGLGLLRELSDRSSAVATIMISSSTEAGAQTTSTALRLGAFDFVLKPTGLGPDKSHQQLKAELTPKIEAFVASRQSNMRKLRSEEILSCDSTSESAIDQMIQTVGSFRHPPKIIGIGVSTGGPAALNQVLPKLPADFPCPIVLVQHMPPKFTKSLADDLDRHCALDVKEAVDGMVVEAGEILIAPGGFQMRIAKLGERTLVKITDDPPERNCKPAVDYLFRSIAHCFGEQGMGVILTGMGDDGTLGCKLLKRTGARILTQDEATCVVYGMPRSVYKAGLSDQVIPLDKIAQSLIEAVGKGVTA